MNRTIDYEFSYRDGLGRRATHRVRIFSTHSWIAILLTDLTEKHVCPSVTNSIEELINALLVERPDIQRERMIVIEHYDDRAQQRRRDRSTERENDESFDLVSFLTSLDGKLHNPSWKSITKADAETWTGASLP
jgi:hypothetical protein